MIAIVEVPVLPVVAAPLLPLAEALASTRLARRTAGIAIAIMIAKAVVIVIALAAPTIGKSVSFCMIVTSV